MISNKNTISPRIVFAPGSRFEIAREVELLNKSRILLICDESARKVSSDLKKLLGDLLKLEIDHCVMHVPDEFSSPICAQVVALEIDLVITIGGGSATGLGKIVALDCNIDLLAIPTTYAGSEMTTIWGRTRENRKLTGRDIAVLPKTVIYDPELTYSLPLLISSNSGMNAIAHAVEALYAFDLTEEVHSAAIEGIEIFTYGLRKLASDPSTQIIRNDLLRGSMLCGFSLSNSTMGIHHKICHTLGGLFNLPHAQMHSAVLPWAVQYNQDFATSQLQEIAQVLNAPTASIGLWEVAKEIGAETSLKNIGYPIEESGFVVDLISKASFSNPRPNDSEGLMVLLSNAYYGSRPDGES